ncbi:MAG: hypothetical protein HYS24_01870 [Ignavibacteriales bacterium]|nr:hypothetical protein [Ignavibacteriales bacterium]
MSTVKRKIGFYSLEIKNKLNIDEKIDNKLLKNCIHQILTIKKIERIFDIRQSNKFHLLATENFKNNCHNITFNSAKHHHRPPLINRDTADLRENPKELIEGELETTHISLKYNKDEIVVLLEERTVGISIGKLVAYFNKYLNKFYNNDKNSYFISYTVIPKKNFIAELEKLRRVRFAEVYVDKRILGSEYLNFAKRIETVQENIVIEIKAKKTLSIKETVKMIARKFYADNQQIEKIRIYGNSNEGNNVLLDTEIIKTIEYIEAEIDNNTGIVNSEVIFESLSSIFKEN